MGNLTHAICKKCRYYRTRSSPALFSQSDLQTPGILKTKIEWDQQLQQRAEEEMRRFEAGREFTYEPFNYAWCSAYTHMGELDKPGIEQAVQSNNRDELRRLVEQSIQNDEERMRRAQDGDETAVEELAENGRAQMDPVSGQIMQVYQLCSRMNTEGTCSLFDPR